MNHLFTPLIIRETMLSNRLAVSPMCMYSCDDGFATDWHLVHLGSRAIGGNALVMTEATAISPEGCITWNDMGIWKDEHISRLSRIVDFLHKRGSVSCIQLAHAGGKASISPPWEGGKLLTEEDGGWQPVAAMDKPVLPGLAKPKMLDLEEIEDLTAKFARAAERASNAGFQAIEIHAAHGYLFHQFLSPLYNQRSDEYGGSFENRVRFLTETVQAVRKSIPENVLLFVRLSCTDWCEDGQASWTLADSVDLSKRLKKMGVDLIDCSSGGLKAIPEGRAGTGYQTELAATIRREADVLTGAVGMITSPEQADHIIRTGQADLVFMGRESLRDPYFPRKAAKKLGQNLNPPDQYARAW